MTPDQKDAIVRALLSDRPRTLAELLAYAMSVRDWHTAPGDWPTNVSQLVPVLARVGAIRHAPAWRHDVMRYSDGD